MPSMANTLIWIPKRLVEIPLVNLAARSPGEFAQYCESDYASRIAHAAGQVIASGARIVMLTGPSASGKTTSAMKLAEELGRRGHRGTVVSLDNFFRNIEEYPRLPDGRVDYESVEALDVPAIHAALKSLAEHGEADIPDFDFRSAQRRRGTLHIDARGGVVIVEGIHALNPRLTCALPQRSVYKIYAGLREEYSLGGARYLPTRDVRLARRMVRDIRFRGHSVEKTLGMWPDVCNGEDKYIKVFKNQADLLLDTSFTYELCVLAPFVRELGDEVEPDSEYAPVLRALCGKYAKCEALPASLIPETSMLREFIGN